MPDIAGQMAIRLKEIGKKVNKPDKGVIFGEIRICLLV
jgi:hypothetical protein